MRLAWLGAVEGGGLARYGIRDSPLRWKSSINSWGVVTAAVVAADETAFSCLSPTRMPLSGPCLKETRLVSRFFPWEEESLRWPTTAFSHPSSKEAR